MPAPVPLVLGVPAYPVSSSQPGLDTGQRLDATGLYYYNARYYDPTLGRFISPDTLVQSPANPQSFNRYSYVLNNPLRYVDPTGLLTDEEIDATFGAGTAKYLRESDQVDRAWYRMLSRDDCEWGDVIHIEVTTGSGEYLDMELVEGVGLHIYSSSDEDAIGQIADLWGLAFSTNEGKKNGVEYDLTLYSAVRDWLYGDPQIVRETANWHIQQSWWSRNGKWVGIGVAAAVLVVSGAAMLTVGGWMITSVAAGEAAAAATATGVLDTVVLTWGATETGLWGGWMMFLGLGQMGAGGYLVEWGLQEEH